MKSTNSVLFPDNELFNLTELIPHKICDYGFEHNTHTNELTGATVIYSYVYLY